MMASFAVRGVSVLDESGSFTGPVDLAVEDGVITRVGRSLPGSALPSLDLDGMWLMPGVFDCHSHLTMWTVDTAELLQTPLSLWALRGANAARRTLEGGVTFVRDAGGADAGLRAALDSELVRGPRLQIANVMLSATGGHADGFLAGPGIAVPAGYLFPRYPGRPPDLADGVTEIRRAVREIIRSGADWLKICTSGGVLSPHDDPMVADWTLEEVSAAVQEARRRSRPAMAHALGGDGIDLAIEAGVRSIEHAPFLTDEQASRMADAGITLVPTLSIAHDLIGDGDGVPADVAGRARDVKDVLGQCVQVARDAGVPVALGTDNLLEGQHGRSLREITHLCAAGMPLEEALLAATVRGAELCGVDDSLGRLAAGRLFDALLFDREPSDPALFAEPDPAAGVFLGGRVVRDRDGLLGGSERPRRTEQHDSGGTMPSVGAGVQR
jgi:imidazolonepropionase-like amidohydrolase